MNSEQHDPFFQLEAAHIVTGCKSRTSHYQLYAELGWTKLSQGRELNNIKTIYAIVQYKSPIYLHNIINEMITEQS